MNRIVFNCAPVPKPRMTQSDRWKQRPCVLRYREFCDYVRFWKKDVEIPGCIDITFYVAMPKSWSATKKAKMDGKPHQQRPDLDNYIKAICDALFDEDKYVWSIRAAKLWCAQGDERVEVYWLNTV